MRLAIVAVAVALVVAGCGSSGDTKDVKPLQTASPSATPASGDPVAPASVKPTRPEDVKSEAGAKAFSIFVMQTIIYTVSTNDAEPLLALSDGASCDTCIALAKDARSRGDMATVPQEDSTIVDIVVTKRDEDSYVVRQTLRIPEGKQVNLSTDEVIKALDPSELKLLTAVVWKADAWRLENYSDKAKS